MNDVCAPVSYRAGIVVRNWGFRSFLLLFFWVFFQDVFFYNLRPSPRKLRTVRRLRRVPLPLTLFTAHCQPGAPGQPSITSKRKSGSLQTENVLLYQDRIKPLRKKRSPWICLDCYLLRRLVQIH